MGARIKRKGQRAKSRRGSSPTVREGELQNRVYEAGVGVKRKLSKLRPGRQSRCDKGVRSQVWLADNLS